MIIGTRGSNLAIEQTNIVESILNKNGIFTSKKIIHTTGDFIEKKSSYDFLNNVGIFVNELDEALKKKEIDIAVHSMKDLPTKRPSNIIISSVIKRGTTNDILLSNEILSKKKIPDNYIIGTNSKRRKSQLLRYNKNIIVKELHGNINTRISKLFNNDYDAIIISKIGLQRLNLFEKLKDHIMVLPINNFCPSPNQGAIAIVTNNDSKYKNLLSKINHYPTYIETYIEREIMSFLNVGCFMPVGINAKFIKKEGKIKVLIDILNLDGTNSLKIENIISLKNLSSDLSLLYNKINNSKAFSIIEEVKNNL